MAFLGSLMIDPLTVINGLCARFDLKQWMVVKDEKTTISHGGRMVSVSVAEAKTRGSDFWDRGRYCHTS